GSWKLVHPARPTLTRMCIERITTLATARWVCNTAIATVGSLIDAVPPGFQPVAQTSLRETFQCTRINLFRALANQQRQRHRLGDRPGWRVAPGPPLAIPSDLHPVRERFHRCSTNASPLQVRRNG